MTTALVIVLCVAVILLAFRGDWHERRLQRLENRSAPKLVLGGQCVCGQINIRHCPVHGQDAA